MMRTDQANGSLRRTDARIREIDIAKAIGIICVLVGHRTWGSPVNRFVYLFHMPFFLIMSGFMIGDECLTLKQILSKELKLFASYLLYSLFFILLDIARSGSFDPAVRGIKYTLTLFGIDTLWFLPGFGWPKCSSG